MLLIWDETRVLLPADIKDYKCFGQADINGALGGPKEIVRRHHLKIQNRGFRGEGGVEKLQSFAYFLQGIKMP